jgi:hypothetical protein
MDISKRQKLLGWSLIAVEALFAASVAFCMFGVFHTMLEMKPLHWGQQFFVGSTFLWFAVTYAREVWKVLTTFEVKK